MAIVLLPNEVIARGGPSRSARPGQAARRGVRLAALALTLGLCGVAAAPARAQDPAPKPADAPLTQTFALHAQATLIEQATPGFRSGGDFQGQLSLHPDAAGREVTDADVYVGFGNGRGLEVWINPEIDQGLGLGYSNGIAAVPNGDALRPNAAKPYFKLLQVYVRQTFNLGGEVEQRPSDQTQLAGLQTANRLIITAGKMNVVSIFDANGLAHDPRNDFLNAAMVDTAAFDYAGNNNNETYGVAVEWRQGPWSTRLGVFTLPNNINTDYIDVSFGQMQAVAELERRFTFRKRPGKVAVTYFYNRERLASFAEVLSGTPPGEIPDVDPWRRYRGKGGAAANGEQQLTDELSAFFRLGFADSRYETNSFTDVRKSFVIGLSTTGKGWGRPDDKAGWGIGVDGASKTLLAYLAAGGLGQVLGDGSLPRSGPEYLTEGYYSLPVHKAATLTFDAQLIANPGYNAVRGPVPIFGLRLHTQI